MNKVELIKFLEADEGGGLIDDVVKYAKNTVSVLKTGIRKGPSPKFRDALKKYGDKNIVKITIQRAPIAKAIKAISDIITLGKFSETAKRLGYDDIFHLSAILVLDDGVVLSLEKNEVAVLKPINKTDGQQMEVKMKKPLLLKDFINKTVEKIGISNYYLYNAASLNCQRFILDHLKIHNLRTVQLEKYIMQDANQLLQRNSTIISAFKKVTDLGGIANKIIEGDGFSDFIKSLFSGFIKNDKYEDGKTEESRIRIRKSVKTRNDQEWEKIGDSNRQPQMNRGKLIEFLKNF